MQRFYRLLWQDSDIRWIPRNYWWHNNLRDFALARVLAGSVLRTGRDSGGSDNARDTGKNREKTRERTERAHQTGMLPSPLRSTPLHSYNDCITG